MEQELKDNLISVLNEDEFKKLEKIVEYAKLNNVPIVRPKTANLLFNYVKEHSPKRVLEIGTAIGYSGALMLKSSTNSTLDTIEKDASVLDVATKNFEELNLTDRVKTILGDAKEVLNTLSGEYDFIFLDGPKAQYIHYLPRLLELLKVGGTLFADNVLFRGMVLSDGKIPHKNRTIVKNLQQFLNEIGSNKSLKTQIIDLEDGISISIKESK
ncbi:MAG: O-methyltransferase [Spirochaetales bacterium]